jgi:parvulin-like peptidyl-prolyl isomerase
MFREYLRSRLYPAVERIGRQQIEQYYQEHLGDFQVVDIVNWQDIFIDASRFPSRAAARAFAEQLAARARAGEDFSKLLQYDNGDSSYRNGEGCGQHRGEIRPLEAEPILFRMRDGEVGPVIEIPTGYHVIRLTKRTYAGTLPLDQKTQDDVRKKLQYQVFEREAKRLVADLKQHAAIEIASSTN